MSGHFTNEYVRVSLPESGPSCIMPPATSTAIFHTFTEGQAGQACRFQGFARDDTFLVPHLIISKISVSTVTAALQLVFTNLNLD